MRTVIDQYGCTTGPGATGLEIREGTLVVGGVDVFSKLSQQEQVIVTLTEQIAKLADTLDQLTNTVAASRVVTQAPELPTEKPDKKKVKTSGVPQAQPENPQDS